MKGIKQILAICLALLIFFQAGSKLLVFCAFNLNKDFISTVLCINKEIPAMHCEGKCQLKLELQKEEQNNSDTKKFVYLKAEIPLVSETENCKYFFDKEILISDTPYIIFYKDQILSSVFHPPEC